MRNQKLLTFILAIILLLSATPVKAQDMTSNLTINNNLGEAFDVTVYLQDNLKGTYHVPSDPQYMFTIDWDTVPGVSDYLLRVVAPDGYSCTIEATTDADGTQITGCTVGACNFDVKPSTNYSDTQADAVFTVQ